MADFLGPTQKVSMKIKVCLVGEPAVGKTSLVRRFVLDTFDPKYLSTIGTNIWKKKVEVVHPLKKETFDVDLIVWDIMGQKKFRDLLRDAYFYGAKGVIAVCDSTRESTYDRLIPWVEDVTEITGEIPVYLLANKIDLGSNVVVGEKEMESVAAKYHSPYHLTSAKTGDGVEEAFHELAGRIVKSRFDKAISELNKARAVLQSNPQDVDALFQRGEALAILGKFEEAISTLHEVTKLDPEYPQVWSLKAEVFSRLGNERMAALCHARA